MKKSVKRLLMLLLAVLLVMSLPVVSFSYSQEYINIPDPNFAAAVRGEMGLPEGAPIPRARAAEMTELNLSGEDFNGLDISSLAGVEYFTALRHLSAVGNRLTELDVSNNLMLRILSICYNQLTEIDVSHNLLLERLQIRRSRLSEIDVSNNTALYWIDVSGNRLTEIDVTNNPVLIHFAISSNRLTEIDVSNNPALERLSIYVNYITGIDVTNNPALRTLNASRNQLSEIDVLNNFALEWLTVDSNQLTEVDVSNNTNLWQLGVNHNRMESLNDVVGWQNSPRLVLGENFAFYPQQGVPEPMPSPWATDYIERAYELGIVPRHLNRMHTHPISRGGFATLAVTLYETVTERRITNWWQMEFSDVSDVNILKAAYIGVVQGVGGGRFDPSGTLTREQAATMLARLAYAIGSPLPEYAATFSDNDAISCWAIDAVGQVQAAGIMSGVGNNMFDPQGTYTREQSIVTMLRLFDFVS